MSDLTFKIAGEGDFEAIHRLNYDTFVEEIPQHARNAERRLVDKFHAENTYAICRDGDRLVGMIAGRAQRPFSLDQKLPDLDAHLPTGRRPVEIRLLAVEKEHRNTAIFARLTGLLAQHFRDRGCDLGLISGTTRQLRLYRHMGFVPFGPLVGTGDAQFQPMYLTLEEFLKAAKALSPPSAATEQIVANYLPGPVEAHEEVRRAFSRPPVSHRSDRFLADFRATRRMLCALTSARDVQILMGSGTLANDAVAAQLARLDRPGLVVSNGEFGDRLVDAGTRMRLEFDVVRSEWGRPLDLEAVRRRLGATPRPAWVWAVHCETSSGILNPIEALKRECGAREIDLALDCISSIGSVPVDLRGVSLASCVSGKALASYPGLSMVFHDRDLAPGPASIPRYLDLGYYAANDGVPFTLSSNLVHALQASLVRTRWPERFGRIAAAGARLRQQLRGAGLTILAADEDASPAVLTIVVPPDVSSRAVGDGLRAAGTLLSYGSGYLLKRNWVQVCLMGEWSPEDLETLPDRIAAACRPAAAPSAR